MEYGLITGYLTNIYTKDARSGNEYLAIDFWTDEEHENDKGDQYHTIRLHFTEAAFDITKDQLNSLGQHAGVDLNVKKSASAMLDELDGETFGALEVPIYFRPDKDEDGEIDGCQYSIGFAGSSVKESSFDSAREAIDSKLAAIKASRKKDSDQSYSADDIPF